VQSEKPKHISEIINASYSNLERLSETAQEKSSLSRHLKKNLKNFGRYIVSAYINNSDILVIKTSSPEFAARLKYEEKEIRDLCKKFGNVPVKIKISSK
jgi:vacuolar-type H+-ATPase subunit E/Vma4